MRRPALSSVLILLTTLGSLRVDAADPPSAPNASSDPRAATAAPKPVELPKPSPKPAAKPITTPKTKPAAKPPTKQATLKKKPRAAGPAHVPDPAVRRAIAGPSAPGEKNVSQDAPDLAALRQADRELFGIQPHPVSLRSVDPLPVPFADDERPVVSSLGLPPAPTSPTQDVGSRPADTDWLATLSQPDLSIRWNTRVLRYLAFYKSDVRGRSVAGSWFKRSGAHEAMIRRILRANAVPEDLIWVALVESGFNPQAYSAAGAAGLWQFVPSTARLYGLVVDRWIDERLDPERSTEAAAKYLSDLYRRFGTWELALAAYNMGLGGLLSAIRKYNTNDFWELSRFEAGLPWETTLYVPKIAAIATVAKNPVAFGLDSVAKDSARAFETVHVPPGTSLSTVASAAGTELSAIESLNPQLLLSRTPPQPKAGAPTSLWPVRVPTGTAARFAVHFVRVRAQETPVERHVLRDGESLADVARARGVSLQQLSSLNGLDPDEMTSPGTVLIVPATPNASRSVDRQVVSVAADLQPPTGYRRIFYRPILGDTIAAVAEALGVTVDDLRRWNLLDPNARLQEGMALLAMVPATRDVSNLAVYEDSQVRVLVAGSDGFFEHHESLRDRVRTTVVVRPNETWQQIAARTGQSVASLERINRRSRQTKLESGERIVVYLPARSSTARNPVPEQRPQGTPSPVQAPPSPEDLPELPLMESQPSEPGAAVPLGSGA